MKVWQEFYCHRCPGGGTYIMVKINMAINHTVVVVCPMCKAQHERQIAKGQLYDNGKSGSYREEICPPKSACSKTPRTKEMEKAKGYGLRGGAVIKKPEDIVRDEFLRERWVELYGGRE